MAQDGVLAGLWVQLINGLGRTKTHTDLCDDDAATLHPRRTAATEGRNAEAARVTAFHSTRVPGGHEVSRAGMPN